MNNIFLISFAVFLSALAGYLLFRFIRGHEKIPKQEPPAPDAPSPVASGKGILEKQVMLEQALSIIENLSQNISFSKDIEELSREIVGVAAKICNVEICALLLIDKSAQILQTAASIGIDADFAKTIHIKNGEEISGVTAKFNDIKIINDLERDGKLYRLNYDRCYKKSLASFPVAFKNNILGVLNLSSKKTGLAFTATDTAIIRIIALESAIAIQNLILFNEQRNSYLNTIITLANAIDAKDPYTCRHSYNVTKYAVRIAQAMKLPEKTIEDIRYAGLLHDIGKIGIRDEILLAPGKLSDAEYNQIKTHSAKGEEIIRTLPFLGESAKFIRHHHERFDGKGYPDAITGEKIEIGARILAISDSFDAMTTERLYHKPMPLTRAKEELIKNKGAQFDPHIVDIFAQILDKELDSQSSTGMPA